MNTYLLEYDPSGRMGAGGGNERLIVTIEDKGACTDNDALITGMRYIASAFSGVHIEYINVYQLING